ncbi:13036_t:CDS:2, partial [Acaulospora colombiana]
MVQMSLGASDNDWAPTLALSPSRDRRPTSEYIWCPFKSLSGGTNLWSMENRSVKAKQKVPEETYQAGDVMIYMNGSGFEGNIRAAA